MAVYVKDDPRLFRRALWSNVLKQTAQPEQLVIAVDGPVTSALEAVLNDARHEFSRRLGTDFLSVVRLPENRGAAAARNAGIALCRGDYIALADADDVSLPERFRLQKSMLDLHPDIDVVTAWQYDYHVELGRNVALNTCPELPDEIAAQLQTRNPVCQPSMMIRRQVFERHGGYDESVGLLEDYDLHLRWNAQGVRYRCLQMPLVRVSVSSDLYRRRGGFRYARRELAFRLKAARLGYLARGARFYCVTALYVVFRLIPPEVRRRCYVLVRKRDDAWIPS
jgi:glycosyltransferase involved in cell wall biosynthesis